MKRTLTFLAAGLLGASAASATDVETCFNCHEPDELAGKSVEEITANLTNPDNKMHKRRVSLLLQTAAPACEFMLAGTGRFAF